MARLQPNGLPATQQPPCDPTAALRPNSPFAPSRGPLQLRCAAMPTLATVKDLVRADLSAVDAVIRASMKSTVGLVDQVAEHIISGGGKRLRPLIVLLASRACGYRGSSHIDAAAFIEFIHTATLLHDDVVDGSSRRRGRDTANAVYGNQASVLVGDFVYSRAFQMMAAIGSQRVMEIMSEATNVIAEGEVLQLMNAGDPDTTQQRYLEVIYRKTAKLFESGGSRCRDRRCKPQPATGTRRLRQAPRHGLSVDRRCARLPLQPHRARQEPG